MNNFFTNCWFIFEFFEKI